MLGSVEPQKMHKSIAYGGPLEVYGSYTRGPIYRVLHTCVCVSVCYAGRNAAPCATARYHLELFQKKPLPECFFAARTCFHVSGNPSSHLCNKRFSALLASLSFKTFINFFSPSSSIQVAK